MTKLARVLGFFAVAAAAMMSGMSVALADQPHEWQIGFQDSVTPLMDQISWLHDWILFPISVVIAVFVLVLILYCVVRFNHRVNKTPSTTSHHTLLEVVWTVVPIIILVAIAIPSFRLLYFQNDYLFKVQDPELTIKAIGYQWYWGYEYPDHEDVSFDSYLVEEADLEEGQPRLLTVDQEVVVPVDTVVRLIVTADPLGVIHAWTIPAFGVKVDAVPGRLNELWFKAEKTGMYYGQCSELCGRGHAFMPIAVRVVGKDDFNTWIETAQTEGVEEATGMFARSDSEAGERSAALDRDQPDGAARQAMAGTDSPRGTE